MKKLIMVILSIMLFVTLSACKNDTIDEDVVYVTVYPMQYLLEQIAGDTVKVKRVPGSTVHSTSISWTPSETIDMINSDLLFYVGAGVDDYIPDNAENVFSDGDVLLIDVSQYISYNQVCFSYEHTHLVPGVDPLIDCETNSLADDPHFWLDPVRMLQAAELVRDKLIVAYPQNSETYENNYTGIAKSLEKLHEDYLEMEAAAIKPIIITVMLFTYIYDRYNIEILSITSSAHTTEIIPADIIEFVEEARSHDIHYIIFEANSNSPAGDKVVDELNNLPDFDASKLYLHGLGNLTDEDINSGSTYISIMYDNLEVLNTTTK